MNPTAIWHDAECGAYDADLALWEELAAAADGPVLDLGCGTGRVALHLARRGHSVVGLDSDPELVATLDERGARACRCRPSSAMPAPSSSTPTSPWPWRRCSWCSCCRQRRARSSASAASPPTCCPAARSPLAIVEGLPRESEGPPPLPDVREVDGWVYSSLPLDAVDVGEEIVIRRLRQTVSPAGELREEDNEIRIRTLSAPELEEEAVECGLVPLGRRRDPPHRPPRRLHRRRPRQGELMELRVLSLYPEQMNIYADRGNIVFLQRRCEWRGIGFSHAGAGPGRRRRPHRPRPLLHRRRPGPRPAHGRRRHGRQQARRPGGGGRERRGAARRLRGYQLLGHSYQLGRANAGARPRRPGTVREAGPRLIGNVAIEVDLGSGPRLLAGFENHGGRTELGAGVQPLGQVIDGHGNNGKDGFEGVAAQT